MDPMLSTAALASAEKLINAALAYDPATHIALSKLAPQVLAVNITSPAATIFIVPTETGINVRGHYEGEITTQITGSIFALLQLANSSSINLKESGVQVIGSTHFLSELQQILKRIDIDWEELLTQVFGDMLGHQGAELLRAKFQWTKDRGDNAMRLASEFLTQELNILPSKAELHYFYQQVDDIRLDTDRLEARFARVFQKTI